ncbi:MAG: efflux RND transporter permease subunit [Phycisphaerae bacterium]
MGIIKFAIENPVKITVAAILLTLFGLLSIFEIPKQLTPDVDQPIVTVSTFWSGASPQEIAGEIVERQEEKLKNITGLRKMTSSSVESSGTITLEFDVGVDKDIALRQASEKLRQVSGYPEEVDEPTISATDDDNSRTIAWIMLRGDRDTDVSLLKTFVEDRVKPILERAEGIASTAVYGGREREIQIRVDAYKLAARGITFRRLEQVLRAENRNISAGTVAAGKRDYTYRTVGEYTDVDQIADTVITYQNGGPVRVRDVAEVVDGFKKQFAFVRSKGEFVIAIPARRETGANVITAMDNLKRQIQIVNDEVLPTISPNLRLEQVYDETEYIVSAIDLVVNNILLGGLLAVAVLILFLRSASATAIIAIAIPLSVMGTFLIITLLGRTLNVVLLAGLAFAIGMVVDNAIVVLENIFRHRQMGKDRAAAALDGAREVFGAVLASTLTTIAVFLPVIFIKEEAGQLFGDIAVAVASAVALSLIISILVIPPLASRFLGGTSSKKRSGNQTWFLARWLADTIGWINRSTFIRLAVVVGFTGASILGSILLMPDTDYLPAGNRNLVFGFLLSPPGYTIDEFKHMAQIVELGDPDDPWDGIRPAWEAELDSVEADNLPEVQIPIGLDGRRTVTVKPPPIKNFFFVSFDGGSFMGCISKVETNVSPLVQVMDRAGQRIPGVFTHFAQSSLFGRGLSGGASIELEIRGDHLDKVVAAGIALRDKLMESGLGFPRPDPPNFDLGRPEIQIITDRAKAADLGLNVRDIGFIVEACIDGAFVGEFRDKNDRIDMAIIVDGTVAPPLVRGAGCQPQQIAQVPIYTPSGDIVPLSAAVNLVTTTAPQRINRIEEMEAVTLAVTPPAGTPLQAAMTTVRRDVIKPLRDSGAIDKSIITSLAGNADKLTTTQRSLIGDFRGTITGPRWFGWSIPVTMTVMFLAAAAVMSAGARILRAGARILGAGARILGAGPRILGAGARILGAGARIPSRTLGRTRTSRMATTLDRESLLGPSSPRVMGRDSHGGWVRERILAPAVPTALLSLLLIGVTFAAVNPAFGLMLLKSRAALAVFITYLLMAALFESFLYPFVIMFSVPLAAVGGFVGLRIVHEYSLRDVTTPIQQLDLLTMLGFVILLGVVVNNAILVVHQALTNMREHDMTPAQAIVSSVETRTRPIFMSALTSIFGMLPLVLMTGAGSELYRGIGSVVVGGLLFSTMFTLFVVPALFSLALEYRTRIRVAPPLVGGAQPRNVTPEVSVGFTPPGRTTQPSDPGAPATGLPPDVAAANPSRDR